MPKLPMLIFMCYMKKKSYHTVNENPKHIGYYFIFHSNKSTTVYKHSVRDCISKPHRSPPAPHSATLPNMLKRPRILNGPGEHTLKQALHRTAGYMSISRILLSKWNRRRGGGRGRGEGVKELLYHSRSAVDFRPSLLSLDLSVIRNACGMCMLRHKSR